MISIIFVSICSTEGNGNKSLVKEDYVVAESEFVRVNWCFVRDAWDEDEKFWYTGVLITSFNGDSTFTAVVKIGLLVESGRLTTGGEIICANTLCTLFDKLSFDVRYCLFGNVGAFNRSIGDCFSFDDVRFRLCIVGSLDFGGSRLEFSLRLGIGHEGRRQLSLDWTKLLSGQFYQGSSIGSLR